MSEFELDKILGKHSKLWNYSKVETRDRLIAWRDKPKADRFEVIDETGRAYVKGSIYGSPVKIQLSYQDDGRTLKVFVDPRSGENGEE